MRLSTFFVLSGCFCVGALGSACGDDADATGTTSTSTTGSGGEGGGSGGSPPGTPFTVLNWNTKNFVNDQNDSAAPEELVKSAADYQEQLQAVAAILGELDADVVILQEVENQAVLDDLNAALDNRYVDTALIDANDPRGVDVAGLSKFPFSSVVSHKDEDFVVEGTAAPQYQFARDCLELHVTFEGKEIVLLGVHFRSKGPPDDPNKRLAEAQRSRAIGDEIAAANPEAGIVVLGDFNDLPGSDPVVAVEGSAPDLYTDAASFVPEADRWTFDFQGSLELIDHQMANPVMTEWLDPSAVLIRHGSDVGVASDHLPMKATYLVR
jgi:endonuclease/exonuclease/phosphatase family metal-dependent hydrolase